MAAAGIYADWPIERSVFNARAQQLSVCINEKDHLRVAVVMPGTCVSTCYQATVLVMLRMSAQLTFCIDAQLGYLTSCPSNVGSAMRVSCRVSLRRDASQEAHLGRLQSKGIIEIRSTAGEHAPRKSGLVDVSFRNRAGVPEAQLLLGMGMLLKST